ncbi:MAG: DUF1800 domain-containing protein [Rhodothermales bacterium]
MNRRSFIGVPARNTAPMPASQAAMAIQPHTAPLTRADARHLVTRSEFGARLRRVNGFIGMTAEEAVAIILQEAEENALPEAPTWYKNKLSGDIDDLYKVQRDWMWRMKEQGFIEKMTLLLHNHLVTGYSVYERPYYAYTYYELLRTYALGNFKELIFEIGLDPAMLFYLDNNSNVPTTDEQGNPAGSNENYARELLELFTMGQYGPGGSLNYTEADIKQIARVLTGWQVDESRFRTVSKSTLHDSGTKTIFGQSFQGNADPEVEYAQLIDFIFAQRGSQIAHYLCRKLYVYFVNPVPDEAFIAEMAAVMVDNDYELKPVLQTLFTSQRFFSPTYYGSRIKSPIDFLIGFLNETETPPSDSVLEYMRQQLEPRSMNQELFNPPNVAGWPGMNPPDAANAPGDEKWLTTSLLPERWNIIADLTDGAAGDFDPVEVAVRVSDPANPFKIAEDLARTLVPVPLDIASIRDVSESFAGDPDTPPPASVLSDPIVSNVSKVLLGDMPHYEWPDIVNGPGTDKARARIVLQHYIALLSREIPEYQLH